jgi:hypothetical protein
MKVYKCLLCEKCFNQKSHYDKHTENKKKPCNRELNDNQKITENYQKITENYQKLPEFNSILTEKSNFTLKDNNGSTLIDVNTLPDDDKEQLLELASSIDNSLICKFCDNVFSRKDYLQLHIKKYCKNKKHIDKLEEIKAKIRIDEQDDQYETLLEKFNTLMTVCNEYEKVIKENHLLKQSIPCANNIKNNVKNTDKSITTNNNAPINNGAINNGVVNTGTINSGNTINIVQFGKEDISKCNLIEMMNVFLKSTGGNIMPNMLKYLNFNPNYPENYNILISDLARENVQIHNGKKFVTKKFKTVKDEILNVLSGHINNMCSSYMSNPKIKKNTNILSKININNISVKLINNDDITPLLKNKKVKEIAYGSNDNISNNGDEDDDIDDDLDDEAQRKLVYFENKRQGLQEIAILKLKDELYNNRDLVLKNK